MPRRAKPVKKTGLGRSLIKQKMNYAKLGIAAKSDTHSSVLHREKGILQSITEQTDIAEFMSRVDMNERNYESRNLDVKLLTVEAANGVLSESEKSVISHAQQQYHQDLRIPRRPHWDESMTKEELYAAESAAFNSWRMNLDKLTAVNGLTITPYEKNGEVWKQLWRVVERSDVVVQIVDARNPLLFRCTDLELYVKEVDSDKVNLLLVNKSDHLTLEQRETWAQYFRDNGIYAVFFSALAATKEDAAKRQERLDDLEEEEESDVSRDEEDKCHNPTAVGAASDAVDRDEVEELEDAFNSNVNIQDDRTSINTDSEQNNIAEHKSLSNDLVNDDSDNESVLSDTSDDVSPTASEYESASSVPESVAVSDTRGSPKKSCQSQSTDTSSNTSLVTTSKLYNREELIRLFEQVCPPQGLLQQHSTIGLVGYPNVGKSSTINCLIEKTKVTVSATPGKTKHFQTLHLPDSPLILCDCPGLVFPGFVSTKQEMIIWGILPIDRIKRDYHSAVYLLCNELPPSYLEAAYSIPLPGGDKRKPTPEELLSAYSVTRSFMSARGRADTSRAARAILKDFMNGRLLHCVAPPGVDQSQYHTYAALPRCKNRVKLTQQQQLFMPETADDVDAHLLRILGINTDEAELEASKGKKIRVKKPKGYIEVKTGEDGVEELYITKPWRNRVRSTRQGKKNPNTNNPYDEMPW